MIQFDLLPTLKSIENRIASDLRSQVIRNQLALWRWPKDVINNFVESCGLDVLPSNECSELLSATDHLAERTAVAVSAAQLLRFADEPAEEIAEVTTWHGIQKLSTGNQIFLPHLIRLTRQLLDLAKEKNLTVALFFEEDSGNLLEDLPQDLASHPDLAVISFQHAHSSYVALDKVEEWVKRIQDSHVDNVLKDVREEIKDPEAFAVIAAQVLMVTSRFNRAMEIIQEYHDFLLDAPGDQLVMFSTIALNAGADHESKQFLQKAYEVGVDTLEALYTGRNNSAKLGYQELKDKFTNQIVDLYPNSSISLDIQYGMHFHNRRFAEALELAQLTKDEYQILISKAFTELSNQRNVLGNWMKSYSRIIC